MGGGLHGRRRRRAADRRALVAARRISLHAFRRRSQRESSPVPAVDCRLGLPPVSTNQYGAPDRGRLSTLARSAWATSLAPPGPRPAMAAVGPAALFRAGTTAGRAPIWAPILARARDARGQLWVGPSALLRIPRPPRLAGGMAGAQADLFAGYNRPHDRFVLGGQVEATQFSDVAAKMAGMEEASVNSTILQTSTLDDQRPTAFHGGCRGRAGFLATPNLLLYGLGGLALGHFTYPDSGARIGDERQMGGRLYRRCRGELKVSSTGRCGRNIAICISTATATRPTQLPGQINYGVATTRNPS